MIDSSLTPDPGLLPGELIDDKYRIERVLGRGGMGVVLLARNLLLGEQVAIKVLGGDPTPASAARLLTEARAAARLHSDYVVRVFDVGNTETGTPYLVMEYLEGAPLSEVLRRRGPLPVPQVVQWVLEVCEGLATAHRHGVVHRDLKPANLFLEQRQDGTSRIKILDFGIAKLLDPDALSTTTHPIGSPVYMAPEQLANSREVDARTDIWGLGVVCYEALTGRTPFGARSLLELAVQLRDEAHVPVRDVRSEVPEALSRVIDRCLEKRCEDRWANVAALAAALRPLGPPGAAKAAERMQRIFASGAEVDTLESSGDLAPLRDLPEHVTSAGHQLRSIPALSTSVAAAPLSRRSGSRWLERGLGFLVVSALGYSLWGHSRFPDVGERRPPAEVRRFQLERLPESALPPAVAPELAVPAPAAAPQPLREQMAPSSAPSRQATVSPGRATKAKPSRARPFITVPPSDRTDVGVAEAATSAPPGPATPVGNPPAIGPLPIDRQLAW